MTQKVSRVTNKKDDHGERELATVSRNNTLQDITMKQTHSPFTLIELLVVIAIIGILASLLLPSLSMARAKGKATQCSGNMRSFSQRMLMYADDYKDYFMPWDIKMNSWAGGYPESRWHNVLDGSANPVVVIFSSEKRLFFKMLTCPGCNIPRTSAGSYYAQHYGYNLSNNGTTGPTSLLNPNCQTLRSMKKPSMSIMAAEENRSPAWQEAYLNLSYIPTNRHGNSCVTTYWDGHVAAHPFEFLLANSKYTKWQNL